MAIYVDKKVKDVVWYIENTLLIHCKTTTSPPYFFTIYVDNSKFPFLTLYFFRSLNGLVYKLLMKDVERDIDQKAWQTKEGLLLRARPIAGKVRRLIQSMATMTIANHAVASTIMPVTLSRGRNMHGASEGSTRNVLSQRLALTEAEPFPTTETQRGQAAQSYPLPLDLKESVQMCRDRLRLVSPLLLSRFPPN